MKSLAAASDQDFEGTPPTPVVLAVLAAAVLVSGGVALALTAWMADRRASDVAEYLMTLGERAERLGSGDPDRSPSTPGSRRSTGSTRPSLAGRPRAPSASPRSGTSPPTRRTSCARR